jgi:glutathione peroxidase
VKALEVYFTLLGFPCNQFGGQEPGTPEEISKFLRQYRVSFPIMNKVRMDIEIGISNNIVYQRYRQFVPK